MSLITIIAKSESEVDWKCFHMQLFRSMVFSNCEIFPIPKNLGFANDALGIIIPNKLNQKSDVLIELRVLIEFLSSKSFDIFELYNGVKIHSDNANIILKQLLQTN